MTDADTSVLKTFHFRHLDPLLFLGTASDRYAAWMGQIYSKERYFGRITRRKKRVGGKHFVEAVLPVESVEEYFQHFRILELDFTFYSTLLSEKGIPTTSFRTLETYRHHLKKDDRLLLKAPQLFFAQKIRRGKDYRINDQYLNGRAFMESFYNPLCDLLDPWVDGIIFEQEYQRKDERISLEDFAHALNGFFGFLPREDRFHVELRTQNYLAKPVLSVLERHKVGQVFSHWTWLPPLRQQFARGGKTFSNGGGSAIVRLMTPRGMRYEDAYARAYPFDRLVTGMMSQEMIPQTVEIMQEGLNQGVRINVIINNRSGGNAPLIAQELARRLLAEK